MTDKKTIFVTVKGGVAYVDKSTVPDGIDVRVLDFDSLESDSKGFNDELDEVDRNYLSQHHPDVIDVLDSLDDDDDEDESDEDLDEEEEEEVTQ
jgi:hypothetical protein